MLADVTLNLSSIPKHRSITAAKADMVKLLHFEIACIILFSTFVAFDRRDLFGSSCDLLVFNHALSSATLSPLALPRLS